MTLATLDDVLRAAVAESRAVGAFNIIQIEHAEAFVAAAERTGLPVVLQISQNSRLRRARADRVGHQGVGCGRVSALCAQLDHALNESLIDEALDLGFTSVMFDGSTLDDAANRDRKAVVKRCHAAGVSVEAELGEIGGKDGAHAVGARTDPQDAVRFAEETGIDALAVAVGSSHAMTNRTAELDLDLITKIRKAVPVPLVLHGSSGARHSSRGRRARWHGQDQHRDALEPHLHLCSEDFIAANPGVVDTRKYLGAARRSVEAEAARLLQLLALR